jgi:hypothetical protein
VTASAPWLVREPSNRHDRNAILVTNGGGDDLGYVSRELAADLATASRRGGQAGCDDQEAA